MHVHVNPSVTNIRRKNPGCDSSYDFDNSQGIFPEQHRFMVAERRKARYCGASVPAQLAQHFIYLKCAFGCCLVNCTHASHPVPEWESYPCFAISEYWSTIGHCWSLGVSCPNSESSWAKYWNSKFQGIPNLDVTLIYTMPGWRGNRAT